MPGLTKCQPLPIVLGVRRRGTSTAPLEEAQSLHAVTAVCKRTQEEEEAEKLSFSLLTGGRIRRDDWRGFMKAKGGVLGEAGSEVKMGMTRRSQAEPEEMSGKDTAEAAIHPPTSGQRGWQRAATSKEC